MTPGWVDGTATVGDSCARAKPAATTTSPQAAAVRHIVGQLILGMVGTPALSASHPNTAHMQITVNKRVGFQY
jgi:hypothetical protein